MRGCSTFAEVIADGGGEWEKWFLDYYVQFDQL